MKKVLFILGLLGLINLSNAIVINANTQSLYLGDNNVSCGRITLVAGIRQSDVENFCSVVSSSYQDGLTWLSVQTTEFGTINCVFAGGRLNECFKDE